METRLCVKCGERKTIADFSKCKTRKDGLRAECKFCMKEYRQAYAVANSEKISAKAKAYRAKNSEARKKTWAIWYANNAEARRAYSSAYAYRDYAATLAKAKYFSKEKVRNITDGYAKDQLVNWHGFPKDAITPDLIELYRTQLMIKRKIKELK